MADWDASNPNDSDIVSQYPANERAARAAVVTNFGVDHHETDDADVGKHEVINIVDNAADPTGASGQVVLWNNGGALKFRTGSGTIKDVPSQAAVDGKAAASHTHTKSDITDFAHTHTKSDITDFQNYRMFGIDVTTNGSGLATFAHGFGSTPAVGVFGTFGGAANKVDATAWDSTNVTVEVRDITNNGALKTNSPLTLMCIVAEAP